MREPESFQWKWNERKCHKMPNKTFQLIFHRDNVTLWIVNSNTRATLLLTRSRTRAFTGRCRCLDFVWRNYFKLILDTTISFALKVHSPPWAPRSSRFNRRHLIAMTTTSFVLPGRENATISMEIDTQFYCEVSWGSAQIAGNEAPDTSMDSNDSTAIILQK